MFINILFCVHFIKIKKSEFSRSEIMREWERVNMIFDISNC